MKQLNTLLFTLSLFACGKEVPPSHDAATLTVVNTIVQGQPLKLATHMATINNNAFAHVGLPPGLVDLYLFPTNDSLHPYYTQSKFTPAAQDYYTLLLSGTTGSPDALLLKETFPYRADSTFGLRFINLAPGSPAVKVTLSTSPDAAEFDQMAYQQVSEFRSYSATIGKSYTFQVKRADNNGLISSLTISGTNLAAGIPRFKHITLVLRDVVGGTPVAGITRINHY